MLRITAAAAALPGLGHLLLGRRLTAALLLAVMAGGISVAALHVTSGLALFATNTGVFAFGVLLRALAILQAFAVVDAYLWALDPAGRVAPPVRRRAVLLNLMLPGAGYLLARAWVRAVVGLAGLAFIVYLAGRGHPYADLAMMVMQAITGFAVYYRMRVEEEHLAQRQQRPLPEPLQQVEVAQLVILGVLVLALGWCGYVMQRRLPHGGLSDLRLQDISVRTEADGIHFAAPPLGLSMSAVGPGWTASPRPSGYLFHANHEQRASLELRVQKIPAFLPARLLLDRIRGWVERQDFQYQRSQPRRVGALQGTEMLFTGIRSQGLVEQRAVIVARQKIAYIVLMSCPQESCPRVERQLRMSLDSLKIKD